ncbi:hypothetical protein BSKO_03007 [Bryopsis sp. KO-2023]|nr:hypothetical protein BSKO_03007 [Bryopsis sp. KO-2023]
MTAAVFVANLPTDRSLEPGTPPIGFFYSHLHESIRMELNSIWQTVLALEAAVHENFPEKLSSVEERCVFLQQIYKYHSVAEDEVVYPALDTKVKNVTLQYSVEHADEEHLFVQLLQMLRETMSARGAAVTAAIREFVCKMGEVRITLMKHLAKEEEQLFPLLLEHFSYTEQAELIAQFLCCIPLAAVEGVLLWLKPNIPQEEQDQLLKYIREAIPDDLLLNLLVTWLDPSQSSKHELSPQPSVKPENLDHPPLNQIIHVHRSIAMALAQFVGEARSMLSHDASGAKLASLVEKHRFLTAVCRFHMLSEEEVMFPEVDRQQAYGESQYSGCQAQHEEEVVWFEDLGRLLADVRSSARRGAKEVAELLDQVILCAELVKANLGQHMEKEEAEVLPVLQENLCAAEQCIVVWRMLRMMPLRLLERVMPWLSGSQSEAGAAELLAALRIGASNVDGAAVELLARWVHRGCSPEFNDVMQADDPGLYHNDTCETRVVKEASSGEAASTRKKRKLREVGCSAELSDDAGSHSPSVSGGMWGPSPSLPIPCVGPSPIDHIFQFHRALKRDFRQFEAEAGKLSELLESGVADWDDAIQKLKGRFQFLRGIYMAHSSTEDDVVFPALESKEALRNICHSYVLDHKQEEELFNDMGVAISRLKEKCTAEEMRGLVLEFNRKCAAVRAALEIHVRAEETELWPLFAEHFTLEEQHRLVGAIIGRTGAEVLQTMLPWVSGCCTLEEEDQMMESLRVASKNTMFDRWLDAIGGPAGQRAQASQVEPCSSDADVHAPLVEVAQYLRSRGLEMATSLEQSGTVAETSNFRPGWEDIFRMNQKQLEAAVRRVSSDDSLEPSRKSYIIQWIMVSKYIVAQQGLAHNEKKDETASAEGQPDSKAEGRGDVSKKFRSYHSESEGVFGCQHYMRNGALVAPCCSQVFACRLCHDEQADHKMDRYKVTEMVCMPCGKRQPVAAACVECEAPMAEYYCSICRLFDNDPSHDIYHCQFCNVCRRGKGLGIDFFHCMECNACMHMSLFNRHKCREKCIECNCPVCNENLFDSSQPIKELPCGHFLHSNCFATYSQWNYTCPVCSKSIGDMSAYFQMLDSLLISDPMPPELRHLKQQIICNDCCKKSHVPYHYVYHSCGHCHSYNTKVL